MALSLRLCPLNLLVHRLKGGDLRVHPSVSKLIDAKKLKKMEIIISGFVALT
jgi:hypothetical protein